MKKEIFILTSRNGVNNMRLKSDSSTSKQFETEEEAFLGFEKELNLLREDYKTVEHLRVVEDWNPNFEPKESDTRYASLWAATEEDGSIELKEEVKTSEIFYLG